MADQTTPQQVDLVSPDGTLGSVPQEQVQDAIQQGYKQPTQHDYSADNASGPGTTLSALAQGVAEGTTGPLYAAAKRAQGVPYSDIEALKEAHPIANIAGQGLGFLSGLGIAGGIQGAGAAAEAAVPLLGKIGGAAAKFATETALMQANDEVSKMVGGDPNASVETAVHNIGMSGMLGALTGAGFQGVIAPLWNSTSIGKATRTILNGIAEKTGGIEGIEPSISGAADNAEFEVPDLIKSGVSSDPVLRQSFQELMEANTRGGQAARDALTAFKGNATDYITQTLGHTPESIEALGDMSDFEVGKNVQESLGKELKARIDPTSEEYDSLKGRVEGQEIPQDVKQQMEQEIQSTMKREGWDLSPSSAQNKLVQRTLEEIQGLKNISDIPKYNTVLQDQARNPELSRVGSQLRSIFREAEANSIEKALPEESPELLQRFSDVRASYKDQMNLIDELNDRLHAGKYSGPQSFVQAVSEMTPEDVVRRLSGKADAGLYPILEQQFPETAQVLKQNLTDQALKKGAMTAKEGEPLNMKAMLNQVSKLSPEMRSFMFSPEQAQAMNTVKEIYDSLPNRLNPSGSARTLDMLKKYTPSSALGMVAWLTGHGFTGPFLASKILTDLSKEIPDAAKLGLLKFMGSSAEVSPVGFGAMTKFIEAMYKGEKLMSTAVKGIFEGSGLPTSAVPTNADLHKLDLKLQQYQEDPTLLMNSSNPVGHYMPDTNSAMSATVGRAVQYLQGIRPKVDQPTPLDLPLKPSRAANSDYIRQLAIVQQPAMVMDHIATGDLTHNDIMTLHTVYPSAYQRMASKVSDQLIKQAQGDKPIPYATKQALSLFMGQPLESSLSPMNIMAAQSSGASESPQQPQAPEMTKKKVPSTAKITFGQMSQTTSQAREQARTSSK